MKLATSPFHSPLGIWRPLSLRVVEAGMEHQAARLAVSSFQAFISRVSFVDNLANEPEDDNPSSASFRFPANASSKTRAASLWNSAWAAFMVCHLLEDLSDGPSE